MKPPIDPALAGELSEANPVALLLWKKSPVNEATKTRMRPLPGTTTARARNWNQSLL